MLMFHLKITWHYVIPFFVKCRQNHRLSILFLFTHSAHNPDTQHDDQNRCKNSGHTFSHDCQSRHNIFHIHNLYPPVIRIG